jgi:hypothetical protein
MKPGDERNGAFEAGVRTGVGETANGLVITTLPARCSKEQSSFPNPGFLTRAGSSFSPSTSNPGESPARIAGRYLSKAGVDGPDAGRLSNGFSCRINACPPLIGSVAGRLLTIVSRLSSEVSEWDCLHRRIVTSCIPLSPYTEGREKALSSQPPTRGFLCPRAALPEGYERSRSMAGLLKAGRLVQ